jgi:hypothetical protein
VEAGTTLSGGRVVTIGSVDCGARKLPRHVRGTLRYLFCTPTICIQTQPPELDLVVSTNSTDDPQKIMPPSTSQVAFGLQYRPASVKLPTLGQGDFLQNSKYWQSDRGIRYIRFQWVDYTNATRYRIIPLTAFRDIISASRPGVGLTMAALGIVGASLAPGFSGTGEYLYTPDLSSLRYCGYAPGHASLLGWFEEKLPTRESAEREDALKVPLCPRGLVRDIVKYVYLTACHLMVVDDR